MTAKEGNLWYLENFDLLHLFCPTKLKTNAPDPEDMLSYKKGDFIYLSDQPAKNIYLIAEGRIKIGTYSEEGKEIIKAVLHDGEVFGEMVIAGEEQRQDFAQVISDQAKVCPLTLEQVEDLMVADKKFALKITKLIGFRLRKMERKLESLVFKDARTRIVEYLHDLGVERGKKVGFEVLVKNFFTHEDIGKMTATSRQTVTSVLNELKNENIITFDRRRLLIRDIDKLR